MVWTKGEARDLTQDISISIQAIYIILFGLRASIPPKSPYYHLYLHFRAQKFEWYVSTQILLEYEEILNLTYSHNTAQLVLHQLAVAPNVVFA